VKPNLVNLLGFQAAWWATILSAANGMPGLAAAASGTAVALHLALFDRSAEERRLLLAATAVGLVLETGNALAGFTRFDPRPFDLPIAPAWMVVQWTVLGGILRHSLGWLRGRYALAAVLGAVAAPPAYLGGERLGALAVGGTPALIAFAAEYAAAMPLLLWVESRTRAPASTPA
jgi:hypothetical protein